MLGCDPDAEDRLADVDAAAEYIRETGFLPLFSNRIRGFSLEEHVPAGNWWTGDVSSDPWEWRQILAKYPDIAYGKFFERKAGFISKKWFPVMANYRRNGYDFDALFEDDLASVRAKKIMDVFECGERMAGREILSHHVKSLAGFGKRTGDGQTGEKNFEGVLTDLQMQTYLIMSDFRQKTNKKGETYGWHIAALETPETKWGYEHVAAGYKEDPADSWQRIKEHLLGSFPEAEEKSIEKVLGIKYPGGTKKP